MTSRDISGRAETGKFFSEKEFDPAPLFFPHY